VANRGLLNRDQSNYQKLAKEKFEGIYLKGLAYTVQHTSTNALVIRNIYDMHPGEPVKP
jgi:hypothetical protein